MTAETKVGLLVLAFIIVLVFFTFKMGGDRLPWAKDEGYLIYVMFDSISGLETKSRVRYAGVDVGVVEAIDLQDGKAKVSIKLRHDVQIRENASFEIGSIGLMGEKYVMIHGGSSKSEWLIDGKSVTGQMPVDMDRLISVLGDIGQDVKAITESIRTAIGDNGEGNRLGKIIDNIDRLTEALASTTVQNKDDLTSIIRNFEVISADLKALLSNNEDNISNSMENIDTITAALADTMPLIARDLKAILEDLREVVGKNRGNLDSTLQNVSVASSDFQSTMNDLKGIMEKIENGQGSIGKLVNDETLHENLNTALVDIDKAAVQMRKFLGQTSDYQLFLGYRGEYLSESSEMKNFVSFKLQPRPDKYYLFEIVSSQMGSFQEDEYEVDFNESPDDIPDPLRFTVRNWKKTDMTFSVQFAKRFHRLTLRGGLIESTGGFGLDIELFRKYLAVSVDSWDFNREVNPHLKLGGRINLGSSFYLTGGWDDFLADDHDSIYFGAGFSFEDDDLKLLLGFLPFLSGQ